MANQWTKPQPLASNCDNCGIKDDLEYFEYVHSGITLCQDCADLPFSQVSKRSIQWVCVDDEYYPPDLPIAHRK